MTGWAGVDQTAYRRNEWLPTVQNVLFRNSWWHTVGKQIFTYVPEESCNKGNRITWGIDYSSTANGGAFTRGDAMPASDTLVGIAAYQTKDWYQAAAKVSGIDLAEMGGNGSEVQMNLTSKAIGAATKNLIQSEETAIAADIVAMIDSAATFSDAALTRSTYGLASYESALSGALTLVAMEDMLEALENTTYGPVPAEEMVIIMARNQVTNLSRLSSNLAYNATFASMNTSLDSTATIDAGRQWRNRAFNGVPIVVVPGWSDADIIVTSRFNIELHEHFEPKVYTKDTAEFADLYHIVGGMNAIVLDPLRAGKLSGVTA